MKKYKKNCLLLILILFLQFLFFYLLLFLNSYYSVFSTIEASRNNSWYKVKDNYIDLLKSNNKIMILSGSNSLFGINTAKIENELKVPVVNYATHAGLEFYIFIAAKRKLKEGDVVLLPLEYTYYNSNNLSSQPLLSNVVYEYLIGHDYKTLNQLTLFDKQKTISYLLFNLKKFNLNKKIIFGDEPYEIINRNGDIIAEIDTYHNYKEKTPSKIIFPMIQNKYSTKNNLTNFINWCKKNNIKVFALAPNIHHEKIISDEERECFNFINKFYKENNVKFLGKIEDGFFTLNDMYDTSYHLNTIGQSKRTKYIINLLKQEEIATKYF